MSKLLLFLATLLPVVAYAAPLNESVFLDSIAYVENTQGWGKHGEFGPYQMVAEVRRQVGGYDKVAATKWLHVILADMKKYNIPINPFNISLIYNAGIGAIKRGHGPISSYHYATYVSDTYREAIRLLSD